VVKGFPAKQKVSGKLKEASQKGREGRHAKHLIWESGEETRVSQHVAKAEVGIPHKIVQKGDEEKQ